MFQRILLWVYCAVAILCCMVAAAALLLCLSYTDSIVPPDAAKEYLATFTWYSLRGYLWVLPLAATMILSLGPCFWRIWFGATLPVGVAAFLAYPVLLAKMPELVHPTLPYEGGMLATGLLYYAVILFAGLLLWLLLRFLFPEPEEREASGTEDAAVLDPANARTVQQIAANPQRPAPKFRFGEADITLIERFRRTWRFFLLRKLGAQITFGVAVITALLWFFLYPQPTEEEALQRDLQVMKEHYLWKTTPVATRAAVHAGLRVMTRISDRESFAGMTREEAEAWLGLETLDADYRAHIRDSSDVEIPSVNNAFESRERFLTLCDRFGHWAVLYIRTDASGEHINISEVQDAGWNSVVDEQRRRLGNDWHGGFFR